MKTSLIRVLCAIAPTLGAFASTDTLLLLQTPTLSQTQIAFAHGGSLWTVPREGGEGVLKLDRLEVWVEPRAAWRQMYREVWRLQRDFFYDPGFHGIDLAAAERIYAPFLAGLGSRSDLNYLFGEMLGQLSVQHMYVSGGARPELKEIRVGLLGADYRLAEGRYQFAHVFDGENWNPSVKAPLTQPGVNVKAGEFLLAVNGRELRASEEVYAFFAGTVGRQTVLRVGPSADGRDARDVTVVPVANEASLRNLAWIEGNRRKVDELSGGRLAYVYVPDTSMPGYTSFNRYFFAQVGKQGAVIDERFNGGGQLADYMVACGMVSARMTVGMFSSLRANAEGNSGCGPGSLSGGRVPPL